MIESVTLAGVLLASAPSAGAVTTPAHSVSAAPASPVLASEQTTAGGSRESYMAAMQKQLDSWNRKLQQYYRRAKEKGSDVKGDASANLHEAWGEVKEHWNDLEDSSGDAWSQAKDSFEDSMHKLQRTWERATSED